MNIHHYEDIQFEIVICKWLHECVKKKSLVDVEEFQFPIKYKDEVGTMLLS